MSGSETLFTAALGLSAPWQVIDIRFVPEAGEIHFDLGCQSPRLSCPACGASDQAINDRRDHTWQHLHFFQYRAFIHARLPRGGCSACGKTTQVTVPWARPGSGFTLLFEALALTLARAMPVAQVARLLGVRDARLWRVLQPLVRAARAQESFADVSRVGVDEKHIGRLGFISLFHDAGPAHRVLFGTAGKDASVFEAFACDLLARGGDPQAIQAVSMDLSKAFQAGAATHLPQAARCFDRFHLIKLANEAVEEVRRAEVKTAPELKGLRWGTLKDHRRWSRAQIDAMHGLTHSNLKTARAWRLKEALRRLFETAKAGVDAEPLLLRWVSWARRCRLTPFKRLGATVRNHLAGIVTSFRLGLSNGAAESINSKVQAAIARARGFRTHEHLMTIIYLTCGKLTHLPVPPYTRPAAVA
ncbi:MAG: ISL3 family transposase [Gammaproteobacteria bacterium]|nr:ISL3 family transposase [Gammaproteobacteria bacterium]